MSDEISQDLFWRERFLVIQDVFSNDERRSILDGLAVESMTTAPLAALYELLSRVSKLQPETSDKAARALWGVLEQFISSFPPKRVAPSRVEELVNVTCACLDQMTEANSHQFATQIWKRESSKLRWEGINSILRLASGVFPQTLNPLLRLLVALSVDPTTTGYACLTLQKRLQSITELSQGYARALISVDDESRALELIRSSPGNSDMEKVLTATTPSESDAIFVQAKSAIPESSYRPAIPVASFGCGCEETGAVTWAIAWNGWAAIYEILRLFVRQIQQAASSHLTQLDFDHFTNAVVTSLEFVERLCLSGSDDVRQLISMEMKLMPVVTEMFLELADPGDQSQFSWLNKSMRQEFLTKTSSCLASLAAGSIGRAQYILEQLASTKGSVQALRSALTIMGSSSFQAIAGVMSIAGSFQAETHLLNGVDVSSIISPVTGMEGSIDTYFSSVLLSFLAESALPIWNTLRPPPILENGGLLSYAWWDFPADALTFLRYTTDLSHNSIPVAKCVSKVIVKAVSPYMEKEVGATCFGILRALLASLSLAVDCLEFTNRKLNKCESKEKELTNLQQALLTTDITNGLTLICSGCAPLLNEKLISDAQDAGSTQLFVRKFEVRYSTVNCGVLEAGRLKILIEDLAAKCLSYLSKGLHLAANNDDIVQIPWPIVSDSSVSKRRSGGGKIREGLAKRLEGRGSIECAELLISVLESGQRGAARSLFGPVQTRVPTVVGNLPEQSNTEANCILKSIVKTIREGLNTWYSLAEKGEENDMDDVLLSVTGRARVIGKYVQFLTCLWNSQNTHWFQDFWDSENIWALLASILKCEGREGRTQFTAFNMSHAVVSTYKRLCSSITLDETEESGVEQRVNEIRRDNDGPATWRQTVAHILNLFSSEILVCAGKAYKDRNSLAVDDSDSKAQATKIGEDLFSNPQFQTFGEVFTERWIHLLLQPEEWLLLRKDIDSDDMMVNEDVLWSDCDTLESAASKVSEHLAKALGMQHNPENLILKMFSKDTADCYGPDYKFDIEMIWSLLSRTNCAASDAEAVIMEIMRLNALCGRADVQMKLTHSYAAIAYSVVFADEFAPVPGKALTYASPQYCGKLCRCLARFIVSMHTSTHISAHSLRFQRDMVQLLAFMSARLAQEELEQGALTAVRFSSHLDEDDNYALNKSPLGQLCFAIDELLPGIKKGIESETELEEVKDLVKCLLVAASYLNKGVAFRDEEDVSLLEHTSVDVLRTFRKDSDVAQCAATAMMSLHSCSPPQLETLFQDVNVAECVFEAICGIEKPLAMHEYSIADGVPTLLLMLAQLMTWLPDSSPAKRTAARMVLRNLSGGSISALFPRGDSGIRTYNPDNQLREPMHIAWCACLSLAVLSMKHVPEVVRSSELVERHELDIMEFAACNLERICRVSLSLVGDWPADGTVKRQHVTIARVEEAEFAAETLFQLSFRAIELVNRLPDLTRLGILELLRFVRLVHKLLRFEPIERWIKPVTDHERQRSEFTRQGKDLPGTSGSLLYAGSPWVHSPQTPSGHGSPPLRSPRQTIIAAISGSGGKTPVSSRGSPFAPPSPGIPPTPQLQSPKMLTARASSSVSPLSPWTPHGAGLISDRGLLFGEECILSLLRGLNSGLGALRNFGKAFNEPFVEPVMHRSESLLDFGTLIALMYHCVTEVQRNAEGERRVLYLMIIENCLQLAVTHLGIYEERGVLDTGFRNELANKMNTVVVRLRKIVPPAPAYSLVHTTEIDNFIRCLHENMM